MDYDFDVSRAQLYCVLYDPVKTPVLSFVGGALPDRLVNMGGTTTMAGQMCVRSLGGQNGDTVVYTAGQTSDPALVWGLTPTAGYTPGAPVLLGPVKVAYDEQGPAPPLPTPGPNNLGKCQSAYAQGFGDGQSKAAPQSNTWGDPMVFQCYFCGYNDGFNGRTKRTVGGGGGGGGGGGTQPPLPYASSVADQADLQTFYGNGWFSKTSLGGGTTLPPGASANETQAWNGGAWDQMWSGVRRVIQIGSGGGNGGTGMPPAVAPGTWPAPNGCVIVDPATCGGNTAAPDLGVVGGTATVPVCWYVTGGGTQRCQITDDAAAATLGFTAANWASGALLVTTVQLRLLTLGPAITASGSGRGRRHGGGGNGGGGNGGGVNTLLTGILPQLLNGLEGQASAAEQPAAAQASQSAQASADAAHGSAQSAAAAAQQAQSAQQAAQQQQQQTPPPAAASRLPLVLGLSAVGLVGLATLGWAMFRKKKAPVAPIKEPRS